MFKHSKIENVANEVSDREGFETVEPDFSDVVNTDTETDNDTTGYFSWLL